MWTAIMLREITQKHFAEDKLLALLYEIWLFRVNDAWKIALTMQTNINPFALLLAENSSC